MSILLEDIDIPSFNARINQQSIKFLPNHKIPNLILQRTDLCSTHRRQIQNLSQCELRSLLGLNSRLHTHVSGNIRSLSSRLENGRRISSRTIGSESDFDTPLNHPTDFSFSGSETRITYWTMCDANTPFRAELDFVGGNVDAVGDDGAIGEETMSVVDSGIGGVIGEHFFD